MVRYIIVSIISGFIFGALDGLINANPLAQRLYRIYQPVAKTSVNVPAGIVIDLVYGFVMAGTFLLLYQSLPGASGLVKGISFAIFLWFFRVLMSTATQWMTLNIPMQALIYTAVTGLLEMLVICIFYGLTLQPSI